jgi:quercetin dioxygenase-like cupin family protein
MYVIHHTHLMELACRGAASLSPGEHRFCAIGPACGVSAFQVWMHTLPPGAQTPVQQHAGTFAALALAGSGKLLVNGGPQRFHSPCTLVVPPHTDFQLVNNAAVPLLVVSVFTAEPTSR